MFDEMIDNSEKKCNLCIVFVLFVWVLALLEEKGVNRRITSPLRNLFLTVRFDLKLKLMH